MRVYFRATLVFLAVFSYVFSLVAATKFPMTLYLGAKNVKLDVDVEVERLDGKPLTSEIDHEVGKSLPLKLTFLKKDGTPFKLMKELNESAHWIGLGTSSYPPIVSIEAIQRNHIWYSSDSYITEELSISSMIQDNIAVFDLNTLWATDSNSNLSGSRLRDINSHSYSPFISVRLSITYGPTGPYVLRKISLVKLFDMAGVSPGTTFFEARRASEAAYAEKEQARIAEEERQAELLRAAEQAKKAAEDKLAEDKRAEEEQRRSSEQAKKEEADRLEQARMADEIRKEALSKPLVVEIANKLKSTIMTGNRMGMSFPETFGIEANVRFGELVYDIGSGAGYFTQKALANNPAHVVAIDADEKGLSVLRDKGIPANKLTVLHGYFPETYRLEDIGEVDLIYSKYMLQLVPVKEIPGILTKIRMLLQKGAKAYIVVPYMIHRLQEKLEEGQKTVKIGENIFTMESVITGLRTSEIIHPLPESDLSLSGGIQSTFVRNNRKLLNALEVGNDVIDYIINRSLFMPDNANVLTEANMRKAGFDAGFSAVEARIINRGTDILFILTK